MTRLYTAVALAAVLGVHPRTVKRHAQRLRLRGRKLPYFPMPERAAAALMRYCKSRRNDNNKRGVK